MCEICDKIREAAAKAGIELSEKEEAALRKLSDNNSEYEKAEQKVFVEMGEAVKTILENNQPFGTPALVNALPIFLGILTGRAPKEIRLKVLSSIFENLHRALNQVVPNEEGIDFRVEISSPLVEDNRPTDSDFEVPSPVLH